jgi:hypothetical protein
MDKKILNSKIRISFFLSIMLSLLFSIPANADNNVPDELIFLDKPATDWEKEAFPLGNGSLGCMVFGGIKEERIQFNVDNLWTGDENLSGDFGSPGMGFYQNFGNLYVALDSDKPATNYRRELNISKAVSHVAYRQEGAAFFRETFCSYPDKVIVIRMTASKKGRYSGHIKLVGAHRETTSAQSNRLTFSGKLENGLAYEAQLLVSAEGGTVRNEGDLLVFEGCDNLTLFLAAGTSYLKDYEKNWRGEHPHQLLTSQVTQATKNSFSKLLKTHIQDYQSLYHRVSLDLGKTDGVQLAKPVDQRLEEIRNGKPDPELEKLMIQYGRYLLIACSRPGTLPANLQGLWNDRNDPPWHGDYHSNINLQMNYWHAETANLAECHTPLFDMLTESLVSFRKATKLSFGEKIRGFTVRTSHNPFGGMGWKWNIPASAWYAQHFWEHYAFGQDKKFLETVAYPFLREVSQYWEDHLKELPDGRLVAPNGWSPEHGATEDGVSYDQQIIWDLFSNTIEAARELGVDQDYSNKLSDMRNRLDGPKIGKWGQLQEWMEDKDDPTDQHRHVSHMFAVYPGRQISLRQTPELANAAAVSLKARGFGQEVGWANAWKTALWGRLLDAEVAYSYFHKEISANAFPNLLNGCWPGRVFQIDANFGITAGAIEMLLQSHAGEIHLLPALPKAWANGSVKGLRARGGFVVDMKWESGVLNYLNVYSAKVGVCKLNFNGKTVVFDTKPGMNYSPELGKNGWISPGNTTYYINPAGGSDDHSGLTTNEAWRTFNRVNQLQFSPGDRIEITSPGAFSQTLTLTGKGGAENPVKVHFASGRYDFFPDSIHRKKYNISNTNDSPDSCKVVGILLEHAKNFEISGTGAEIVCRGKMIEVCIDSCENISIAGLHFDYHRPTVSEFTVVAAGDDYADILIHKDSDYKIKNDSIIWYGEGWTYHTPVLAQELNLETNDVKRLWNPLKGLGFEELKPGLVRVKGKNKMKKDHVYQLREIIRDYAAVFTRGSKNISWKDVNFHFMHGMGIVSQFSENLTFDSVAMAPDSTSGRTTAAWADCLHFSGCKGKLLIKDCIFSGAHDDAINVHGTYLSIVEKIADNQLKVRFMQKQTYGIMAFNRGDEIEFVNHESYESYGMNRVKEAVLLNPKEMLLTFEKSSPRELTIGDVIENVTWTPEVEIRGCRVSRIPTRGFLLSTRRKVLVEGNEFLATHMNALNMAIDANSWYESGYVRDMTIRNNKFIRCAEPVIEIAPWNRIANNSVYQNIRIENNEFVLLHESVVMAKATKNLVISGNSIYSGNILDDKISIKTTDCTDVKLVNNKYIKLK